EGGRARGVEAATSGGGRVHVECDTVIVACGTIHTPLFLRRNGLGLDSVELCRNLAIHPATAVRALFDERIDMARGVPQSYFVDEFADEGIMLEGAAGPPEYASMSLPPGDRGRGRRAEAARPGWGVRGGRGRPAELDRGEPADHDHGARDAPGLPPAGSAAAGRRARAGVDRPAAHHPPARPDRLRPLPSGRPLRGVGGRPP